MQIPLIKGDKVDSDVDYRDALPVNMTAVNHPIKGASGYMFQWYGLTEFVAGQGVDRGARWVTRTSFDGHYRVSGSSFIKVNADGTTSVLGAVAGSEQVRIAFSFNNIAIVAGKSLYYYNPTDGLRQITDTDIGSPIDVVWADGYFILTDGEDIYHSDILDEESFSPLNFSNAQFRPDPTYGLGVNEDNELVVYGVTTTQYYTNQGLENFTYSNITLKALKQGILGTHCKAEMNGRWYCISRREETSPSVTVVQGGGSKRISSREIDKILASYTDAALSTSVVECISDDAIRYVLIHLPDKTLLFNENIAESMGFSLAWSVLKSDTLGDNTYRAINFVRSLDTSDWICGDKLDSKIGRLDPSVATHYDDIAEWLLFTPLVKMESLSIDKLEMETISGFAPNDDATVFISQTLDGYFYGKEWTQLYGQNLDYGQRFYVRRLGYVRDIVGWRFRGASRSRMSFALLDLEAS